MPEPRRHHVRPIPMTRTLTALLAALVLLAGCGSADTSDQDTAGGAEETSSAEPSPTGSPSLPSDEPPLSSSFTIEVPGLSKPLLVTQQNHPRGGFQVRVFSPTGATWTELQLDGRPLVPFVATDVQERPLSVDCQDGGLVLTEAVAHEPAGVAFAWDVKQTTYAVEGATATKGPTEEIADNVLPKQLAAKYPELVKHALFESCRAAG